MFKVSETAKEKIKEFFEERQGVSSIRLVATSG